MTLGAAIAALITMAETAKKKKYSEEAIRMLRNEFGMLSQSREDVLERAKKALLEPRYIDGCQPNQ